MLSFFATDSLATSFELITALQSFITMVHYIAILQKHSTAFSAHHHHQARKNNRKGGDFNDNVVKSDLNLNLNLKECFMIYSLSNKQFEYNGNKHCLFYCNYISLTVLQNHYQNGIFNTMFLLMQIMRNIEKRAMILAHYFNYSLRIQMFLLFY